MIKRIFILIAIFASIFWSNQLLAATQIINANGGKCSFSGATGGLQIYVADNGQFQVTRCSADGMDDMNSPDLLPASK